MKDKDRQQMIQRYVAEKTFANAGLRELSKGIVDPVEQMETITRAQPRRGSTVLPAAAKGCPSGWLSLVIVVAICVYTVSFVF